MTKKYARRQGNRLIGEGGDRAGNPEVSDLRVTHESKRRQRCRGAGKGAKRSVTELRRRIATYVSRNYTTKTKTKKIIATMRLKRFNQECRNRTHEKPLLEYFQLI